MTTVQELIDYLSRLPEECKVFEIRAVSQDGLVNEIWIDAISVDVEASTVLL